MAVSETLNIRLKDVSVYLFALIFLAMLLFNFSDQTLTKLIEADLRSPMGASSSIWLWGVLSLASSLLFPLTISLLCSYALAKRFLSTSGLSNLFIEKFELAVVETLRAWGKSFLWTFVFIIPGLIKFTYYFLSPYVVLFSQKYQQGEVDALDYSTQVTKTIWWRLNGYLFLFYFILPFATSLFFDEYKSFLLHPLTATFFCLIESGIAILFHYFILKLFLNSLKHFESILPTEKNYSEVNYVPSV